MSKVQGFSLIELVMILVLLGIGSVVLVRLFGHSVGSLDDNAAFQTGAQAVQQCGEHIFGNRRRNAYGDLTATNVASYCNALSMPAGYTRSLVLTDPYAGPACLAGATCKQVLITVSDVPHGSVARGTVMLVSY
ncbi:MAG: type II secretion system GspH family protein [Gammaproteobacteria bacterium]|nr:type II secretion system GspH family protein [Gammaproteobacteria bacterium]